MTFDTTRKLIASLYDGGNRSSIYKVFGESLRGYRKTDLKQQHGTVYISAMKS